MTQPAAAPRTPWCPATWPATPPTTAPLRQPLASADTVVAANASAKAVHVRKTFIAGQAPCSACLNPRALFSFPVRATPRHAGKPQRNRSSLLLRQRFGADFCDRRRRRDGFAVDGQADDRRLA